MYELAQTVSDHMQPGRRQLGAYYTPSGLADVLCNWAIQSPQDVVLEPCFGACAFLNSARDRLAALGAPDPVSQLCGCDVDPGAFTKYLETDFPSAREGEQFLLRDFLTTQPADYSIAAFDAIVSNPPYVSHHRMTRLQKTVAAASVADADVQLSRRASLWAYFLVRSLRFLRPGGRMAWVLPASFLHADYATALRKAIAQRFQSSLSISVGERLFMSQAADEKTVVLLADGWGITGEGGKMEATYSPTVRGVRETIDSWSDATGRRGLSGPPSDTQAHAASQSVRDVCPITELGVIAQVSIGIVTGANRFFVVSQETVNGFGLQESVLTPILARSEWAAGIRVCPSHLSAARRASLRALLIDTGGGDVNEAVSRYLATYPVEGRTTNSTFRKREPWYDVGAPPPPDAFLPYMRTYGPRLILNRARTTSLNNIHHVRFLRDTRDRQQQIAISLLSTFSQLSAELVGRTYGAGVLKHEPSEAKRIELVLTPNADGPHTRDTFMRVTRELERGNAQSARRLADDFVLRDLATQARKAVVRRLGIALAEAQSRRLGRNLDTRE